MPGGKLVHGSLSIYLLILPHPHYFRAFSDLLGKFLVPMKLGNNCVILGKNTTILGKNNAILSKIGKVYLLHWDFFLLIMNVPGQLGFFSANWEKNWYLKPDPVLYREKALYLDQNIELS